MDERCRACNAVYGECRHTEGKSPEVPAQAQVHIPVPPVSKLPKAPK